MVIFRCQRSLRSFDPLKPCRTLRTMFCPIYRTAVLFLWSDIGLKQCDLTPHDCYAILHSSSEITDRGADYERSLRPKRRRPRVSSKSQDTARRPQSQTTRGDMDTRVRPRRGGTAISGARIRGALPTCGSGQRTVSVGRLVVAPQGRRISRRLKFRLYFHSLG